MKEMLKKIIKKIVSKFGLKVIKCGDNLHKNQVITLKPKSKSQGNVLLSYTINPFLLKDNESFHYRHTCDWECFQMAQTFLDFGFDVDVINYHDERFVPKKEYSFFIDVLSNMERIAPLLNKGCVKIFHSVFAHWLFHNGAEYQRSLALLRRKGVLLKPERLLKPTVSIEYADYITILGDQPTFETYRYAKKPMYRIPISTQTIYPWQEDKDYEACKNTFLWLGGAGLMHKGLDLILDVFAEMSDNHLYVCGPIQKDKDFERTYYKELFQTPNIHTIGWIDVTSNEFIEITKKCIGMIYPSCSESQSGAVVNCLHAGLIPIISYESGVNVSDDFGVTLKDCSIDEIKNSLRKVSGLSVQKLKQMSHKAWEYARANHTRERFAEEYKKVVFLFTENKKRGIGEKIS